jgi:hypothetical protein
MKANSIITNLTSKNYKAFSLFLFLTLVLWFIIQMAKTYTLRSQIEINIQKIPNYIVVDSLNKSFDVEIKSNGLKSWQFNLSDKSYSLSYDDVKKDSLRLSITSEEVKKYISEKYDLNYDQISISKNILNFPYKKKSSKFIPIKPDVEISFSPGYNTTSSLVVSPDSVLVSGSKSALSKITELYTKPIDLKNVNNSVDIDVDLIIPYDKIDTEQSQVNLFLQVEKFSENATKVNINVINKPDSLDITIFPEKAEVSYLISLKDFDKISKLDFKVICDYQKRFQETGVMIPEIAEFPDNILNPKLKIKKVDYLIKKKYE